MTQRASAPVAQPSPDEGVSLLAMASVLLRWRRAIIALAIAGGLLGLIDGLLDPRLYTSSATFIPKAASGGPSGLALAASQLGINIGSSGGEWGPAMYVELLRSRALLEPVVRDTLVVAEQGGKRMTFLELLGITGPVGEREMSAAVGALGGMIIPVESKKLGGVTVTVRTKWPSVSLALAQRLLERINEFNLQTRKAQIVPEREFAEMQARESERALREAEDRLQAFLQTNRQWQQSPSLVFDHDRLEREVGRRSSIYTTLLQSREEARIRELRDVPVIAVLEAPRLAFKPEKRKTSLKASAGAVGGLGLGIVLAFLWDLLRSARRSEDDDAREFFQLLEEVKPRFARRQHDR
jgi:hypothetical protein